MADISQTAANVRSGSDAKFADIIAGEGLSPGNNLYKKASDSRGWGAIANDTAEKATLIGVTVGYASAGDKVPYQHSGKFNPGGTVTPGVTYGATATSKGIGPLTERTSGQYLSVLGPGVSATEIDIQIQNTGETVP